MHQLLRKEVARFEERLTGGSVRDAPLVPIVDDDERVRSDSEVTNYGDAPDDHKRVRQRENNEIRSYDVRAPLRIGDGPNQWWLESNELTIKNFDGPSMHGLRRNPKVVVRCNSSAETMRFCNVQSFQDFLSFNPLDVGKPRSGPHQWTVRVTRLENAGDTELREIANDMSQEATVKTASFDSRLLGGPFRKHGSRIGQGAQFTSSQVDFMIHKLRRFSKGQQRALFGRLVRWPGHDMMQVASGTFEL